MRALFANDQSIPSRRRCRARTVVLKLRPLVCASSTALEDAPCVGGDFSMDGGARLSVASIELIEQIQDAKARDSLASGNL
jgi:hypothetical protein